MTYYRKAKATGEYCLRPLDISNAVSAFDTYWDVLEFIQDEMQDGKDVEEGIYRRVHDNQHSPPIIYEAMESRDIAKQLWKEVLVAKLSKVHNSNWCSSGGDCKAIRKLADDFMFEKPTVDDLLAVEEQQGEGEYDFNALYVLAMGSKFDKLCVEEGFADRDGNVDHSICFSPAESLKAGWVERTPKQTSPLNF